MAVQAALDALEKADQVLLAHVEADAIEAKRCVADDTPPAKPIILDLICNGMPVRALADTGCGTVLMSTRLAANAKIPRRPLVQPAIVSQAIDTMGPTIELTEFSFANLRSEEPNVKFGSTFFKIAELGDRFDMILGSPFLAKHKLITESHNN